MKINSKILPVIISLGLVFAGHASAASRYYEKSEQIAYAVSDCDTAKVPTCKTYYIDAANGNDSWNGLAASYTGGTTGPFKTIAKALDRYSSRMKGGNVFKIRAGTYYERISIGNLTGTSMDAPFVIGSYGDGEVIIDGSNTNMLTWQQDANSNIYVADYSSVKLGPSAQATPQAVVMDDNAKYGRPVDTYADLNTIGEWYYDVSAKRIFIYTAGVDPAGHGVIVIKRDPDTVDVGIYNPGYDHITVAGLTVRGAGSYGYWGNTGSDYVTLINNEFKFSGKGGILVNGGHAKFQKNNVYGTVLLNWPRGTTWDTSGGWPAAVANKGAYAQVSGNRIHDNGGEGLILGDNVTSPSSAGIIEDNVIYDNWSVNVYLDHYRDGIIRNNLVYCSGPVASDAMDVAKIPAWTNVGKIYKRMRPDGIMTADEDANPITDRTLIYNNVINGCASGYNHYAEIVGSAIKNSQIINNTIIVPQKDIANVDWIGIRIPYNSGHNNNSIVKNNIVYGGGATGALLSITGAGNERGVIFDNNVYYGTGNATPFSIGSYGSTLQNLNFENFKMAMTGHDAASIYADPLFANATMFAADGVALLAGSPAIDAGVNLGLVSDFFGNVRPANGITDIGAIEYGAIGGGPTVDTAPPATPTGFSVQ